MAVRITVKTRIWGGFVLILMFLLGVGTTGFLGFSSAASNLQTYSKVSENGLRNKHLLYILADLRRNVLQFTERDDRQAVERIRGLSGKIREEFDTAIASTRFAERKAGYPGLAHHRLEHQDFLSRFDGFRKDVESGRSGAAKALFDFCANWLKGHILGEDMAMAKFVRKGRAA